LAAELLAGRLADFGAGAFARAGALLRAEAVRVRLALGAALRLAGRLAWAFEIGLLVVFTFVVISFNPSRASPQPGSKLTASAAELARGGVIHPSR
jgi:hypothetical protein